MSSLIHKDRRFKIGFCKRIFSVNAAENRLLDKTIQRPVNHAQGQYFDTASLLAFCSLYGLIDSADAKPNPQANVKPVVSKNLAVHSSPKPKSSGDW